MTYKTHIGGS